MTAPTAELQTVRLQKTTDGSHKEYVIELDHAAATVTTRWGRIGYVTNSRVTGYDDGDRAMEAAEDKLYEKTCKGYVQVDDETAAAPLECSLTVPPAPVTVDDTREYLVAAKNCYGQYIDLVFDGERGGRCAQVTGSLAMVDFLRATKTGHFFDETVGGYVRHRVVTFEVTGRGDTVNYVRRNGLVVNESTGRAL